ncbi:MAG: 4-(cytidine 5'-diphospho)-2-C-methyl-D-erythritol kinase [Prevotellaceae bacterium]|jgi:4-diphosphocytidyl-2-C-methyl-D-erythritol kinase|nr:4-(cytidine 5'-diphospho)-2-C-methyl-D-erythritol kinase [Prevotellaceae bacterium]
MVSFPNAKINLGLNVVSRRNDGFHNIETVFFPLAELTDALEIVEADRFSFETTGVAIDISDDNNLCVRAYRLMKEKYALPPVAMHLHKNIPTGAGLGGGSSDASFTIRALNTVFDLQLNSKEMKHIAMQLGSDCAFFIDNVPSKASGRGEILEALALDLSGLYLALVKPDIHISTKDAYRSVVPQPAEYNLVETLKLPPAKWKYRLINVFEQSIFPQNPAIADIKAQMYLHGALYASMSGSGSTIFGLFEKPPKTAGFADIVPGISCFEKIYLL